ncbi:hypothetical protein HMPREF1565_3655 [Providencia alcalifaciens RIMD 1656011]|nr:hypothetical protein HMPREF1565_3655 [Providencia alcalifaciens RIMD 1656011]EUD06896.1 hypothetical protein HMPREF1564_2935 [Providencia alcalifaciens R90-1475]
MESKILTAKADLKKATKALSSIVLCHPSIKSPVGISSE